jgi:hypothetical protein
MSAFSGRYGRLFAGFVLGTALVAVVFALAT